MKADKKYRALSIKFALANPGQHLAQTIIKEGRDRPTRVVFAQANAVRQADYMPAPPAGYRYSKAGLVPRYAPRVQP